LLIGLDSNIICSKLLKDHVKSMVLLGKLSECEWTIKGVTKDGESVVQAPCLQSWKKAKQS
jgi:hypothetical protein